MSFYINYTDFIGSGDERFIEIGRNSVYVPAKGGRKNTSITWKVNVSGGEHTIYAVVDPENRIPEWPDEFIKIGETIILRDTKVRSNNVNSCILHVRLPQLNIINLSSEPSEPVIESNVSVITLINNSGNETASSTVRFYMEKHLSINKTISSSESKRLNWLQSIPEKLPIRVHFKYIEIHSDSRYIDKASEDGFVRVYVDNNPVNLIVKSKEVAQGQPIMLSEINFDSPCGKCMERNETHGICIYRRWEDVWTEWRSGKEIKEEVMANLKNEHGHQVNRVKINLSIDKFQVFLGSKEIILPAGGESTCNISWNASSTVGAEEGAEEAFPLRAGENYTLIANVEDKIMRKEVYLHGTDLAVTKLLVNDTYYDGDVVNITARVSNLGLKNATEFIGGSASIAGFQWIISENERKRLLEIRGTNGNLSVPDNVIDVMNSGTTLYFTMGIAGLVDGWTFFTGDDQIRRRPADEMMRVLKQLGAKCFSAKNNGKAPLAVRGVAKGGKKIEVKAKSSQYLSSVLIASPLCENDTEIVATVLNENLMLK